MRWKFWKRKKITGKSGYASLVEIVPIIFAASIIVGLVSHILNIQRSFRFIWITSPGGSQTVKLPLYLALRVIKKHRWLMTKVIPIPSRFEALMIAITGRHK